MFQGRSHSVRWCFFSPLFFLPSVLGRSWTMLLGLECQSGVRTVRFEASIESGCIYVRVWAHFTVLQDTLRELMDRHGIVQALDLDEEQEQYLTPDESPERWLALENVMVTPSSVVFSCGRIRPHQACLARSLECVGVEIT
jgi:hypothetical protein